MKIQILGPGCPKCKALTENVEQAVRAAGVNAEIEKVTSIQEIMKFGVMMTPALAIEGKVVAYGKVLSPNEIVSLLMTKESEAER